MSKKIFVSHGDIILDKIYNGDLELIKQDGGGCNWNDLYNLSLMGETCFAFGTAGNDNEGKLAISSLQKANVNTSYIKIEEKRTNIMNIIIPNSKLNDNTVIHSWYSPITNKFTMNFSENLPDKLPDALQDNEVYLILDKFLPINLEFLKSIKNRKVCLDVGHIRFFEHFTKQYLLEFFKYADYMQLNNSVLDLLFERLDVKNEMELFDLLNLKLLVLTKGKRGAIFLFRDKSNNIISIFKEPEIIVSASDTSGAGDAFFSRVVREFAYAEKIDKNFIDRTFALANAASRDIITHIGSRKTN